MQQDNHLTGLEIAVTGMAARFPGAGNIHRFWENLKNGMESISFFSREELEGDGIPSRLTENPDYIGARGVVAEGESFDANFFEYSPKEAEIMDPQVRLFHECAWEALEDAGCNPWTYPGLIGMYAGASPNLYWEGVTALSGKSERLGPFAAIFQSDKDFLSLLISYKLNLRGPVFTFYTACSTSLAAVHLASRALLTGECHMALSGGVTVSLPQKSGYRYQEGMIFSRDGHCRVFDRRANGTLGGNGVGVVVLKPLAAALEEGDHIYAVIKGTAVNNDGDRRVGFTAPGIDGQAEVITRALHMAEVEPGSIRYIEAHGTGTVLGDPVEIEALKSVFKSGKTGSCGLGSVKSNIGHLDCAAGIAGFIKAVLILKHKAVPPSLHFESPNPKIDFDGTPFYVNRALTFPDRGEAPLRVGVSSFGMGGTNAHVILEEAPGAVAVEPKKEREYRLILLSAKSETALASQAENLAGFLKENPRTCLADMAYTLQTGRKHFPYRRKLVCSGIDAAIARLTSPGPGKTQPFAAHDGKKTVVFMFPGLGAQYVNMGLDLYRQEPLFRAETDRCFEILKPLMAEDIKDILYPSSGDNRSDKSDSADFSDNSGFSRFQVAQVVIFIFEYALARLLMHWGIKPDALIGYSFGEYTAACISGVFSLPEALKLIVARGRLLEKVPAGGMLSVPLPREEVRALVQEVGAGLAIAIDNGPSCIVSGAEAAVDAFAAEMQERKLVCLRLKTCHGLHSPLMEPILAEFNRAAAGISRQAPQIPYISNVTGTWIRTDDAVTPAYWGRHLAGPVRFAEGIGHLLERPNLILVEVGPDRELCTLLNAHLADLSREDVFHPVNLVRHPRQRVPDLDYLLNKVGQLWLYGLDLRWEAFYPDQRGQRLSLPTYPFERQSYVLGRESAGAPSALLAKKPGIGDWFYLPTWKRSPLAPHPAAGAVKPVRWLVLALDNEFCSLFIRRLRQEGHEVISAAMAGEFAKLSDNSYTFDPGQESHYTRLLEALPGEGNLPWRIVHCWSMPGREAGSGEVEGQDIDRALVPGFYSLVYLARALGKHGILPGIELRVVTGHLYDVTGQEAILPQNAPIMGPLKVIPQEYPFIRCGQVDLLVPEPGSPAEAALVEQLLLEFTHPAVEAVVAYRNHYRWLPGFEPVRLGKVAEGEPVPRLRENGVYLITGGLGKIGLTLAAYLVESVHARVILTGRSGLPGQEHWERILADAAPGDSTAYKIRRWQQIEAGGGGLMTFQVDVTDLEGMKTVMAQAEERWGPINGVIHAAGDTRHSIMRALEHLTPADCRQQFMPKVYGLLTLEKALRGRELDFCWLTSSLSPLLGGLGLTAYSAANHFMDAFVKRINRQNRQTPSRWISVNWADWKFSGGQEEWQMTPAEGVETFRRILFHCTEQQVAVSTVDLPSRIERWVALKSLREAHPPRAAAVSYRSRPPLENLYEKPSSRIEQAIAGVLQDFLGIEAVGIHDNFFELGATSLNIIQINTIVRETLRQDLSVMWWFEYPTIKSLTGCLAAAAPAGETPGGESPGQETEGPNRAGAVKRGKSKLGQLKKKGENVKPRGVNEPMEDKSNERE